MNNDHITVFRIEGHGCRIIFRHIRLFSFKSQGYRVGFRTFRDVLGGCYLRVSSCYGVNKHEPSHLPAPPLIQLE